MKTPEIDHHYQEAFIALTPELEAGVERAFERGEREMKKRYKMMTLLTAAAALALVFAVGALAVEGMRKETPDRAVYSVEGVKPAATLIDAEKDAEKAELSLRAYLDGMYERFCTEQGRERKAAALYRTLAALLEMEDYTQEGISACLMEMLEMDADFIRENGMTEVIAACLDGKDVEVAELAEDEVVADEAAEASLGATEDVTELMQDGVAPAESMQESGEVMIEAWGADEATQEGRGYYFVSEAGASEEGKPLDAETLERLIAEYEPFDVTYDAAAGAWRWKGRLVRCFLDVLKSNGEDVDSGSFEGSLRTFKCTRGSVDIRTLRDMDDVDGRGYGRLIGIEQWTAGGEDALAQAAFRRSLK